MKKILKNEDNTISIPLKTDYTLIIARKEDFSKVKCVIEKIDIQTKALAIGSLLLQDSITINRLEEFDLTREELIQGIKKEDYQYLIWNEKGPQFYQLLEYVEDKGLTVNHINFY
jgi:hypothetical protein